MVWYGLYRTMPGPNRHSEEGEREKEREGKRERREGKGRKGRGEMAIGGPSSLLLPLPRQWASSRTETVETGRRKEKENEREGKGRKGRGEMATRGLSSPLALLSRWWASSWTKTVEMGRARRKERKERRGGKEKQREKRPSEGHRAHCCHYRGSGLSFDRNRVCFIFLFSFYCAKLAKTLPTSFFSEFSMKPANALPTSPDMQKKMKQGLLPMFRSVDSGCYHRRRVSGGLRWASVGSISVSPPSPLSLFYLSSFSFPPSLSALQRVQWPSGGLGRPLVAIGGLRSKDSGPGGMSCGILGQGIIPCIEIGRPVSVLASQSKYLGTSSNPSVGTGRDGHVSHSMKKS